MTQIKTALINSFSSRQKEFTVESEIKEPAMQWIPCTDWQELPVGEWLVKVDKDKKPYHVAVVTQTGPKNKFIIVGNFFHWDMGKIVAYTAFGKYESDQ